MLSVRLLRWNTKAVGGFGLLGTRAVPTLDVTRGKLRSSSGSKRGGVAGRQSMIGHAALAPHLHRARLPAYHILSVRRSTLAPPWGRGPEVRLCEKETPT